MTDTAVARTPYRPRNRDGRTRVFIATEHPTLRDALERIVGGHPKLAVVETSPEGDAGAASLRELLHTTLDVVLLDIPPHEEVAEHTRIYVDAAKGTRVVGFASDSDVRREMRIGGVDTVVLKDEGADTLIAELLGG